MLKIHIIGGVGRFGGNSLIIEQEGIRLAIDCGLRFIQDAKQAQFQAELPAHFHFKDKKLNAYLITHGHDDHIGALPFIYENTPAPIYATAFTCEAIKAKLSSNKALKGINKIQINKIEPGKEYIINGMKCIWISINHSIPEACAIAILTNQGWMIHSGDFRACEAPFWGPPTDWSLLKKIATQNLFLLLSDSTSIEKNGFNAGDASLLENMTEKMSHKAAVVVTTYSRHIERVALIVEACLKSGRRLLLLGKGLKNSLMWAYRSGLEIKNLDRVLVKNNNPYSVPRHKLLVLATGCQAEKNGALSRITFQEMHGFKLKKADLLIFSSRTIPGNEQQIETLIRECQRIGVKIETDSIHVSGHGYKEDLARLLNETKPQYFIPIHSNERQRLLHSNISNHSSQQSKVLLPSNGQSIHFSENYIEISLKKEHPCEQIKNGRRLVST